MTAQGIDLDIAREEGAAAAETGFLGAGGTRERWLGVLFLTSQQKPNFTTILGSPS